MKLIDRDFLIPLLIACLLDIAIIFGIKVFTGVTLNTTQAFIVGIITPCVTYPLYYLFTKNNGGR